MEGDRARCTECGGEMELGIILDNTHGATLQQKWLKGPAKKSWWGAIKVDRNSCRTVETMRCTACGFLKSYAK